MTGIVSSSKLGYKTENSSIEYSSLTDFLFLRLSFNCSIADCLSFQSELYTFSTSAWSISCGIPSKNELSLLPATVSNFSCPFFSSSSSPSAIVFRLPLFASSHNNVWLRRVCCYISTMTTVKHLLSLLPN